MRLLYPPRLDTTTKEEIRDYFLNGFEFFESIFNVLTPDAFYIQSEPTRHPMIFYYGHTAVFFINKLYISGWIQKRIHPEFESIFAVGVDEMAWDDIENNRYRWPRLNEVSAYRQQVKEEVVRFIDKTPLELPIKPESPFWIVLMGCEHERIHIETSSVLHRQMPLHYIRQKERFKPSKSSGSAPKNELVTIPSTKVRLGKKKNDPYYGWDNEYGTQKHDLKSFQVSKYLVTNGEFLAFVEDGGYEKKQFWDKEGIEFLQKRGAKHPHFWVKDQDRYLYRAYDRLIELPLDFPVDVNALEAEAFCRWKSSREHKNYTLLSEAEYMAVYERFYSKELVTHEDANVNFAYGFSSCSVTRFKHQELYDVAGNAWCWSRTPIDGFEGFEVHPAYDDFSTPTFDGKHNLILGASWASSGNELLKHSRYAFRKHFFQHASFRYCITQNEDGSIETVEKDPEVIERLEEEYFDPHYLDPVYDAIKYIQNRGKALDMGCGCGRSSFELAKHFTKVEGMDFSARFIKAAVELQKRNYLKYTKDAQPRLLEFDASPLRKKVQFWQADENNLKPGFHGYDFVLYRGDSPHFLKRLRDITSSDAVVVCLHKNVTQIDGFEQKEKGVFVRV